MSPVSAGGSLSETSEGHAFFLNFLIAILVVTFQLLHLCGSHYLTLSPWNPRTWPLTTIWVHVTLWWGLSPPWGPSGRGHRGLSAPECSGWGCNGRARSPLPSLRSRLPKIQLWGLGERCKLPQRGLGRSPSRQTILALKSDIWWQQF